MKWWEKEVSSEMQYMMDIATKIKYVSREWNESSVEVLAEMKCEMQEAAKIICMMKVATWAQVKFTLNENHPWSIKAITKIKIYEGCSNCNNIYNVSIIWNDRKGATKRN